jgi:hypothetical protein
MDELFKVGDKVSKDGPTFDPAALAESFAADPALAELLGGGGDIEQYLQSYEQMLQDGISGGGPQLNQVDPEGGITVRPDPGFVVKTREVSSGMKVFLNIVSNEHVEAPHMKSFAELEGEEGCRVPLSVGTPVEDFDKKQEPCVTYDLVANPTVVAECETVTQFRDSVVQLCLSAVAQKYKIELDTRYKLPKMKYKGTSVQLQRLRKSKESQIQELSATRNESQQDHAQQRPADAQGNLLPQPDFRIFYSLPGVPAIDGFAADWGPPPEEVCDAEGIAHIYGLDLPVYRTDDFREKIRGSMKNEAERQPNDEQQQPEQASSTQLPPGVAETREMLSGRTCVVQLRLPELDRHTPALKQLRLEVSDECLRVLFPLLPRTARAAYAALTIWWPQHFWAEQASADWDPKTDTLTVTLPTSAPAQAASGFDQELLDALF